MGKYIGPKNKIARRFGVNLGLKSEATKVARRLGQMPGVHGPKKRAKGGSSYSKQLIEKQKAKFIYGVLEKQFLGYYKRAKCMKGDSGVNLQTILETRLDNVIYRMGFALTRAQARQMVNHGMFTVNGKNLNIPSHIVKVGDVIAVRDKKLKKSLFLDLEEKLTKVQLPSWISVDPKTKSGKILNLPTEQDFDKIFDVKLIIEYFSTR